MSSLIAAGSMIRLAPSADKVSPGLAGFIAVFLLALATVLLIRSMVGHLRKVRYSPEPPDPDQDRRSEPAPGASARPGPAGEAGPSAPSPPSA